MTPIRGPRATTKIALPTMCQPKAAGSFSRVQYSETVRVKLLRAAPRKKPDIDSQTINWVQPVCSAMTGKRKELLEMECVSANIKGSPLISNETHWIE